MRHASAVSTAVVSCVAGVLAIAPAKADIFDFSFGAPSCVDGAPCAFGTFTTGAAAPAPGFELITGLTFNVLKGVDDGGNPFSFTNVAGKDFELGAAFSPTTDAFTNSGGGSINNIGGFQLPEVKLVIDGHSFAQLSGDLSGAFSSGDELVPFLIIGALTITPKTAPAPVPEASTWAMLLLGFGGLGLAARRRAPCRSLMT
ncbi:MAG TPA: PEP-CTERM sorting domain-containing protein [Roseiarcus sp.]|jgi:hypothetical protein